MSTTYDDTWRQALTSAGIKSAPPRPPQWMECYEVCEYELIGFSGHSVRRIVERVDTREQAEATVRRLSARAEGYGRACTYSWRGVRS